MKTRTLLLSALTAITLCGTLYISTKHNSLSTAGQTSCTCGESHDKPEREPKEQK